LTGRITKTICQNCELNRRSKQNRSCDCVYRGYGHMFCPAGRGAGALPAIQDSCSSLTNDGRTTANVAAHTARNRGQQRFPEGDHLECTDAQCRKVSLAFQLPVNPGFLPACLLQLNFNAAPMRLKYHALRKLMRGYDSHKHILRAIEGQAHRKFPLRMHGDRC
jgi:hypothetical protein